MKKTIVKILSVILCLLMAFFFASCEQVEVSQPTPTPTEKPFEPQNAGELWAKIDETMNTIKSYETAANMLLVFYSQGMRIETSTVMKGIFVAEEGKEFSYTSGVVNMTNKEASLNETYTSTTAFYNGKMYIQNKMGDFDQKFCSDMTYSDFLVAQSDSFINDLDILGCTTSDFTKNEDGTWSLNFSGYTKKVINSFLKESSITEKELGGDILDMEIKVKADADFLVTKMNIALVFDESDNSGKLPALTMIQDYSNHNAVEPDYTLIKTEEFKEVADVRVLDKVEESIDNIKKATSGKVTIKTIQKTTVGSYKETENVTTTMSYSDAGGSFSYDISVAEQEGTAKYTYKNGVETVKYNGQTTQEAMSEDVARDIVEAYIEYSEFDNNSVVNIEKVNANVYKFIFGGTALTKWKEGFEQSGFKVTAVTQTYTITFEGEAVKQIDSNVSVKGTYSSMNFSTQINAVTNYSDIVQ